MLLLGALYLLEVSVAILALALPRLIGRPLRVVVASHLGLYAMLALSGVAIAVALIGRRYARDRREGTRRFAMTGALNLLPVAFVVAAGEIATRFLVYSGPEGEMFAGLPLLPRDWGLEASRNRALLDRMTTVDPYLVADETLGWTVGPGRRSADGLSQSSVEGIRSARAGASFAGPGPGRRIVLMGDSFTFCLDVVYEDTWGYRLEQLMGSKVQVLNFGVPGYGVDQAYLRYLRDARGWHGNLVVLGIFPGDLERALMVYPFIGFPGTALPFAKPRFVLKDAAPSLLNVPVPPAATIFSHRSIAMLPFVEYDISYREPDWRWRPYHYSELVRIVLSRYPLWPARGPAVSQAALKALNEELLRNFVRLVREEGSIPLVLYMPGRNDFRPWAADPRNAPMVTREILQRSGIEYTDLTSCVAAVPEAERFAPEKRHYAPRTNAAIAVCLREAVSGLL